jgi:NADPH:quinone reductase-like Zn-dependent oxidoreductase
VESVGKEVHGLKKGDRVYGINLMNPKGGFYAQYSTLKAEHAAVVPKKLSIQQAGAMAVDAVTALQGLDDTLHLRLAPTPAVSTLTKISSGSTWGMGKSRTFIFSIPPNSSIATALIVFDC